MDFLHDGKYTLNLNRPRAMTESSKVGLNKMSEMKTSPEKLMTQGTKDLLNIGTILVIGADKQHQHEADIIFLFKKSFLLIG